MAQLDRAALKAFFETGDKPTQTQFADLIDSLFNFIDDFSLPFIKVTKLFSDFQPNATNTGIIPFAVVPAGYQINRLFIKHSTLFSGGLINSAKIFVRDSSNQIDLMPSLYDVYQPPGDTIGIISAAMNTTSATNRIMDFINPSNILLGLTVDDPPRTAIIDDLTQGSLDIYYRLDKIL